MKIFYKDGFYIDEQDIPNGAVEITEQRYIELLNGQSTGKVIVSDNTGNPILIDPAPSDFHELVNGQWVISQEKQAQLLENQQNEMWEKIKKKRYENGLGGVYIARVGKWFQTGEEEKTKYLGLDKVIDSLGEINWKCYDNSFIKMDRTLLNEIFLAMVISENADHINAEKHRAEMLKSADPLNYDFSTGWSANYEE
ncbi:TPA: DUF4376 domain-containing protein [Pasteurella multocida]